jgi:hypothetical protein
MGKSSSKNETVNQAYDNRSITEVLYENDNRVDYDVDNRVDYDVDNRVDYDVDNRVDYDVDNRVDYDVDNRVDTDLGDGAIMASGNVSVLDGGAVKDALEFAKNSQTGYFEGVTAVLQSSEAQNSAIIDKAFKSTVGGMKEANDNTTKIAIAAGIVTVAAAVFIRK